MLGKKVYFFYLSFLLILTTTPCKASEESTKIRNISTSNELLIKRGALLKKINTGLIGKNGTGSFAIIGMAGMGKTQLAKEYAHTYSKNYNIVWWMDANQDLLPQFRELGLKMKLVKACIMPDLGERTLQNWIRSVNKCSNKYFPTVLLIIDDVKNKKLITPIIQGFKNARLLLTSKDKSIENNAMPLKCFTREESIAYLHQTLPQSKPDLLNKLAATLNDYPLALTQASSYIRSFPSISLEEYIKLYHEKRKELWKEEEKLTGAEKLLRDYQHTVASTFTLLLDQVKKSSPHAFELLKLSSVLGNKDIPKKFLKEWSIKYQGIDELTFHDALSNLIKLSLFEANRSESYNDDIYSLHASLHEFIRDNLSRDEVDHYLREATNLISSRLPESTYKMWKALFDDRYLEFHLESLIKLAENYNSKINGLLKLKIKYLSYIHFYKSDYQMTASIIDELDGQISSNNSISLFDKGKFLTLLGNIATTKRSYDEAISISEQAEQILSQIDSAEAKEELFFLYVNNLMDFYNTKGDLKKAEETGKKAELILPQITHPTYLALYYFMRALQLYNMGAYKEACSYIDRAIKIPSTDFPDYFHIFNKIIKAEILARSGELEKASELLESNYENFKKHYPNESNFKLLRMDMTRALIYLKQDNLKEALHLINGTIKGLDKLFKKSDENPIQGFSHIILGEIYDRQNLPMKAQEEYKTAEKIYSHIFKTIEVDDISYLYKNFITLGIKMKDEGMIKKYLQLLTDHFGLDHPNTKEAVRFLDEHKISAFS